VHNEYVVYNNDQVYPEFIVHYRIDTAEDEERKRRHYKLQMASVASTLLASDSRDRDLKMIVPMLIAGVEEADSNQDEEATERLMQVALQAMQSLQDDDGSSDDSDSSSDDSDSSSDDDDSSGDDDEGQEVGRAPTSWQVVTEYFQSLAPAKFPDEQQFFDIFEMAQKMRKDEKEHRRKMAEHRLKMAAIEKGHRSKIADVLGKLSSIVN
jgi:hypothetical protein